MGSVTLSQDRVIDFGLISLDIQFMFLEALFVPGVPWGPHGGIIFKLVCNPLDITGQVLCTPKALPMQVFNERWAHLNQFEQYTSWKTANNKAKRLLAKQRRKTGVAILGCPTQVLDEDIK